MKPSTSRSPTPLHERHRKEAWNVDRRAAAVRGACAGLLLVLVACSGSPAHDEPADGGSTDAALQGDAALPADATRSDVPTEIPLGGCSVAHTVSSKLGGSEVKLIIDTGSTTLGVAASDCTTCQTTGVTRAYVPGPQAVDMKKPVIASYGGEGGLGWKGTLYQDRIQLGGVDPTVTLAFGAIHSHQGFFFELRCDAPTGTIDNTYEGILGLGTSDVLLPGTTSFLDAFSAGGAKDVLAVRLCHDGGSMWLGGYDPASMSAPPQWAPMRMQGGYFVPVTSFEIAGKGGNVILAAGSSDAPSSGLLDTGGPTLFLPSAVYTGILQAVTSNAYFTNQFGDSTWFANLSGVTSLSVGPDQVNAMLPALTINVAATPPFALKVPATDSYITWSYDGPGHYVYYPSMLEMPAASGNVLNLGNVLMRSYEVIFDRTQGRVGFGEPRACK